MKHLKYVTNSEQETARLAAELCPSFLAEKEKNHGLVVCLSGEMGCGKTVFVKGFMQALGYEGEVRSPTFSLCNEYAASVPVYHLDLYRLNGDDDLFSAGVFEVCEKDAIVFIEWPERADSCFSNCLELFFSYGETQDQRVIQIGGFHGA